jgi:hypothetical protein
MIINPFKKYVIMRVPKTGSTTLFNIINKQTEKQYLVHLGHLTKQHLPRYIGDTYNIYAFYRDPHTRFVSSWQKTMHSLEGVFSSKHVHSLIKKNSLEKVRQLKNNSTLTFNDVTPDLIRSITIKDYLEIMYTGKNYPKNLFGFQKNYYTPNTILFGFDNYEINVRTLLDKIGLDSTVEIKKTNSSNSEHIYETITDEEKNMIVDFYKPDYDYFASRDIYFESNQ